SSAGQGSRRPIPRASSTRATKRTVLPDIACEYRRYAGRCSSLVPTLCRLSWAGRFLMSPFAADKDEIACVDEQSCALTRDKDRILPVKGVRQQRTSTHQAEKPESVRDHAALCPFAG